MFVSPKSLGYGEIEDNINIPWANYQIALVNFLRTKTPRSCCYAKWASAMTAIEYLAGQSYTNLHNVTGGFKAWGDAGLG